MDKNIKAILSLKKATQPMRLITDMDINTTRKIKNIIMLKINATNTTIATTDITGITATTKTVIIIMFPVTMVTMFINTMITITAITTGQIITATVLEF